jgi:DNA-directed RNA polymerase subunit N
MTCGALIGDLFEEYQNKVKAGNKPAAVLDSLGIKRYCCRRMFLSHLDIVDELISYK